MVDVWCLVFGLAFGLLSLGVSVLQSRSGLERRRGYTTHPHHSLMAGLRGYLKEAAAGVLFVTLAVTILEMDVFYRDQGSSTNNFRRLPHSGDIMINPAARLPNEGRLRKNGGKCRCAEVRPGIIGFGFHPTSTTVHLAERNCSLVSGVTEHNS